ncbi:MAG TPA: ABC transporter permease subunit, partial [Verrucomicrobiae bacterium]|nr:ABC transporter permease subunit [Verrucomicrobiae bacterium]
RRRGTYALRLFAALAASTITLWLCFFPVQGQPPAALGQSLFSALTTMAFAYCLLVGPFLTADCVSTEKRDGTLGLLFLTDLRSYDVVLGKWIAASLAGFYGLLAVLPSLGVPLLLGGVTPGEYGRIALAVVNAILFSLTAGMFASAVSRDQTKAILGSVILVLALSGLLPGLLVLALNFFVGKPLWGIQLASPELGIFSPVKTGQFATDPAFKANPKLFWTSLGVVNALCWTFMIGAVLVVRRVWRQEPANPQTRRRWLLRLGRTGRWQRRLKHRLDGNPVYALASRHRWPHWVFWALVGIVAINIYWLTIGQRRNPAAYPFHRDFSTAMYFINRVWIAAMACRFFVEARRNGALELLLTTPIEVGTILWGRRRALIRLFFWPVLVIGLLHYAFLWGSWKPHENQPNSSYLFRMYATMATGSLSSFLTDVLALTAVGGWFSLSSKKTSLVVLKTFILVTLIPWVLVYLSGPSGLIQRALNAWGQAGFVQRLSPNWIYWITPAFFVTKNLLFFAWASWKVRRHFRAAAAETYGVRNRIKTASPGSQT